MRELIERLLKIDEERGLFDMSSPDEVWKTGELCVLLEEMQDALMPVLPNTIIVASTVDSDKRAYRI